MPVSQRARALSALLVAAAAAAPIAAAAPASAAAGPDAGAGTSTTAPPRHVAHFPTGGLTAKNLVPRLAEAMLSAASLTMATRTSDALGPISCVVDVDMPSSNFLVRLTLPEGSVEVRSVDGQRYLQAPITEGMFYAAKAEDTTLTRIAVSVDPVRPVRALFGAVTSIRATGLPVDLEGVPSQAYEVVVATAKLQDGLGDLGAGIARDQLPPKVTLTFWIDEQDHLRRATSNIAGTPVEMLFTNWGFDFGIEAPPEEQIAHIWPSTR
ncbi:hypothetical protein Cch01nite_20950 [Cellulomonas chitinilytica]|uniref:DUF2092 domain-containing protein n=1 Tax=Cellulomonas chitinilytica TaxID=398759 RepID=A0A919P0Z4_9CELL|nr:hypothetical protein [Cellulomonas chitinilytica]GIG21371.1 hypothetical protein Cch01nite_20950 [Cellulomonas chitinilytica]